MEFLGSKLAEKEFLRAFLLSDLPAVSEHVLSLSEKSLKSWKLVKNNEGELYIKSELKIQVVFHNFIMY